VSEPAFERVLLKLSGEALMGDREYGQAPERIAAVARAVGEVVETGVEMAIVVGGGNILRGTQEAARGMDRATADYAGMLATVLNALTVQDALEQLGVFTRVLSAIEIREVAEVYIRRRAMRHLEKNRVVIFAAGTGNPYFTTDTAAVLRAIEIGADVVLKGTKVDGVYSSDPKRDPSARFFDRIGYMDILNQNLAVMDSTAISLCRDNRLRLIVFNVGTRGNLVRIVNGETVGTVVGE